MTFQREPFANAWPGMSSLVAEHYREVAYPDGFPADSVPIVDVDQYQAAENDGRLVVFTLREESKTCKDCAGDGVIYGVKCSSCSGIGALFPGDIHGYATFWIGPFPQRKGMVGAWQDAVFIQRSHRATIEGTQFIASCDNALRELGVSVVHHSVRPGRDFSQVLLRAGYQQIETVYAKNLGGSRGQQ